jgi:hypothetical protein
MQKVYWPSFFLGFGAGMFCMSLMLTFTRLL